MHTAGAPGHGGQETAHSGRKVPMFIRTHPPTNPAGAVSSGKALPGPESAPRVWQLTPGTTTSRARGQPAAKPPVSTKTAFPDAGAEQCLQIH